MTSSAPEKVSLSDFYDAMTMPEEDAVETYFGDTLEGLLDRGDKGKGLAKWSRAIVFVLTMRSGKSPLEAHGAVAAMSRKDVADTTERYLLIEAEEQVEAALNWDEENPQTPLGEPGDSDS